MQFADMSPGESAVLADGSLVTRRFNGGFRVRGADPGDVSTEAGRAFDLAAATVAYEVDEDPEVRAAAHDDQQLHHYWTVGKGKAKWVGSPHPWTTLYHHLIKYVDPERAKRMAADWFHEVFGFWPGSDLNRVTHGKPPRGHKVGPG